MRTVITKAGEGGNYPKERMLKCEFRCYSCRVWGEKDMLLDPDHDARRMAETITFFFAQQHFQEYPQCKRTDIKTHYQVVGEEEGVIKVDTLGKGIWGIR